MSEARYWEEYDAAKSAALKMAAKLSAREKGLMVRARHCNMKDEAQHDRTRQRLFEQSMVSLDRPDENGEARWLRVSAGENEDRIYSLSVVDRFGWVEMLWDNPTKE